MRIADLKVGMVVAVGDDYFPMKYVVLALDHRGVPNETIIDWDGIGYTYHGEAIHTTQKRVVVGYETVRRNEPLAWAVTVAPSQIRHPWTVFDDEAIRRYYEKKAHRERVQREKQEAYEAAEAALDTRVQTALEALGIHGSRDGERVLVRIADLEELARRLNL